MAICSEEQVNGNPCTLVLEAANFPEAFESRLEWLSNQGLPPQSPAKIGIFHEEISELKFLFPTVLAYQRNPIENEEYLELWATPSNLYRDPKAPHYSLYYSLEGLVTDGNPFRACIGLGVRSSYFFLDQDEKRNLLLADSLFKFRTQSVLEDFMDRYNICRLFVNPNRYNINGESPITCISQRTFWEARIIEELAAVAKHYGFRDPNDILGFVSLAKGLMKSKDFTTLEQLATMIEANKGGYL